MSDTRRAVRLLIQGRVQGVGYREWMVGEARRLGLGGWVRNLGTGDVEAVVVGAPDRMDRLVEACRRGPPLARVTGIDVAPASPPDGPGFRRLPTA